MIGARECASMFETGQHGRLYLVSGKHARGRTFHIFVLPEGEPAIPNGDNAPLNKDAVEVYGVVSGQPGWTEKYGWLHEGRWQADFMKLVSKRYDEMTARKCMTEIENLQRQEQERERKAQLLSDY